MITKQNFCCENYICEHRKKECKEGKISTHKAILYLPINNLDEETRKMGIIDEARSIAWITGHIISN